ncbi:MAG: hypothetical protein N2376_07225 [Clostridia bacterium]|nr:hypothetical protein [Clostridia bacterium]
MAKGQLTDTLLNIEDAGNYQEWTYKTASRVTVVLSMSPSKSLVFADLDNGFATINVLAGTASDSGSSLISREPLVIIIRRLLR